MPMIAQWRHLDRCYTLYRRTGKRRWLVLRPTSK